MARIELQLPKHLETAGEPAVVSRVHIGAGEPVRAGEPILEFLNAHGMFDLVAPATGVVVEVLVKEGEPVRAGRKLGVLESGDRPLTGGRDADGGRRGKVF